MKRFIFLVFLTVCISSSANSQTVKKYSADVDGDGRLDKIEYREKPDNFVEIIVSLGRDDGNFNTPFTFCANIDRGHPNKPWGFADMNNDGKADFVTYRGDPNIKLERVLYLSTGSGLEVSKPIFTDVEDVPNTVVTLGNETYSKYTLITADKVVLKRGCRIRLLNGSKLIINTKELSIESTYTIDATGNPGKGKGEWCANNCHCQGSRVIDGFLPNSFGHDEFEKQKSFGDRENKGGNGGKGGSVFINYCALSGIVGGLSNLSINTSGGNGGLGVYLKCPCHPDDPKENFRWASGDGGNDGIYRFTQKCN